MYHKTNLLTAVLVVLTISGASARADDGVVWSDDFEQYKDGQRLHGINGWQSEHVNPEADARVMMRVAPT